MKRWCFVCRDLMDFKQVPTAFITINRHHELLYCARCNGVVFISSKEKQSNVVRLEEVVGAR